MDGQRFDTLTRTLAIRRSRRLILQGLGGGITSGVLGFLGWRPVAADSDCADQCAAFSPGRAHDRCLEACARVDQARARAEDARSQANERAAAGRAQAENAIGEGSGGDVGDPFCGTHHIFCYIGDGGTSDCQQIGDLGDKCFSLDAFTNCTPCDGWQHFYDECNTNFASECGGNCYADRNDYCTCIPGYDSCQNNSDCCSGRCTNNNSNVELGICFQGSRTGPLG